MLGARHHDRVVYLGDVRLTDSLLRRPLDGAVMLRQDSGERPEPADHSRMSDGKRSRRITWASALRPSQRITQLSRKSDSIIRQTAAGSRFGSVPNIGEEFAMLALRLCNARAMFRSAAGSR